MESLYMACTGGEDWRAFSEPLKDAGQLYYFTFIFFIAFVSLAVLNMLTGIFTEKAIRVASSDKAGVLLEHLQNEREMVEELCRTFLSISGKDFNEHAKISK